MGVRKIPESWLVTLWKRQPWKEDALVASRGTKLRVIHPGEENQDSGPDFRGAIIATEEQGVLRGDIELHVHSREWRAHGHHRNPEYNEVILQVTIWDNGEKINRRQNGKDILTLSLETCLPGAIEELMETAQLSLPPAEPCSRALERRGARAVAQVLDRAGEERFFSAAESFRREMRAKARAQVLYEGIMRALGYARNKQSFQELAAKVPLSTIEALSQETSPDQSSSLLQALLLGTAGLLPSQRRRGKGGEEEPAKELERLWHSLGGGKRMDEDSWRLFRVRPVNFPTRRLVAVSHLLAACREDGLFSTMLRLVSRAAAGDPRAMERGLLVTTGGYWAEHYDFGKATGRRMPALIGRGRAREIGVNILLPFFFSWAEGSSWSQLREKVLHLYRSYPPLMENHLLRRMAQRLWGEPAPRLSLTACQQQGLLQLHRAFCLPRKCAECPLG